MSFAWLPSHAPWRETVKQAEDMERKWTEDVIVWTYCDCSRILIWKLADMELEPFNFLEFGIPQSSSV